MVHLDLAQQVFGPQASRYEEGADADSYTACR
jgi:hypothetical protein